MQADLKVLVAHGTDTTLDSLRRGVEQRWSVAAQCRTIEEVRAAVEGARPDLIVAGVTFPDGNGIDACIEIGEDDPMPAVIVTTRRSMDLVTKAMEDHVMAYLIEPVSADDLRAAVIVAWSRFQQLKELEQEVGDLRAALGARKVIERAKGVLMGNEGLNEAEAFAKLRKASQDSRRPIADVAEDLLRDSE